MKNDSHSDDSQNDPNNLTAKKIKDFICPCGRSYGSYPAVYAHIKRKHDGIVYIYFIKASRRYHTPEIGQKKRKTLQIIKHYRTCPKTWRLLFYEKTRKICLNVREKSEIILPFLILFKATPIIFIRVAVIIIEKNIFLNEKRLPFYAFSSALWLSTLLRYLSSSKPWTIL